MAHWDPSSSTPMPTILRYGIAVLSVAIAIGFGFLPAATVRGPIFDANFLFAVAATVWYAGSRPGALRNYSFSPQPQLLLVCVPGFFLQSNRLCRSRLFSLLHILRLGCRVWVSVVRRRTEAKGFVRPAEETGGQSGGTNRQLNAK